MMLAAFRPAAAVLDASRPCSLPRKNCPKNTKPTCQLFWRWAYLHSASLLVLRLLASPRQKTPWHNTDNNSPCCSDVDGMHDSSIRLYPAPVLDATQPTSDTSSACYRFFDGLN